jgi:ABC-type transporter Mla subunit MlaD
MNNEIIQLACIAVIALGVLVQTILLIAICLGMRKGLSALKGEVDDLKSSAMPTVEKARVLIDEASGFLTRVGPKVESTVTDLSAIASNLRAQAAEVEIALGDILEKVDKQSSRIDTMFSGTLDAVDKASSFVTQTVGKPVRQLSGLVAGVKAAVESLRTNGHPMRNHGDPDDKDMFV